MTRAGGSRSHKPLDNGWGVHYRLHALDANVGHVVDFLFDGASWGIAHVVVAIGEWWPRRSVLVPVGWVGQVSWSANRVDVSLLSETINRAPEYDAAAPPSPGYLARVVAYYGSVESGGLDMSGGRAAGLPEKKEWAMVNDSVSRRRFITAAGAGVLARGRTRRLIMIWTARR